MRQRRFINHHLVKQNGLKSSYICTYKCSYVHMFICSYVHMFICSYVQMFICSYVHMFKCSYVHMFICSYIHTFIRSYVHMFICIRVLCDFYRSWGILLNVASTFQEERRSLPLWTVGQGSA
jgi:hypothetical protein